MLSMVKMSLKGEVGSHALNSHGNYIVDHGKSWKNHRIAFSNFCGNPAFLLSDFSFFQEYEDEIKKQRDRTISMLAEKDREIQSLRATSTQRLETDYLSRYRNPDMAGASSERQSSEDEAVERLLRTPPGGQGEMTLLYFAQEQARKDVDITTLRKQKRELELALRELQMSSSLKQEQLHDEIDRLKEEIRKLERSITREDANLEYLKNVTYKFLISNDAHGKQQMLNAITTILQFSPQEKGSVQAHTKGWWI